MHHALWINEILFNIFSYIPLPDIKRHTRPNLFAVARTCRAFKEPALDVLWENLTGASPIARCVPEASCPQLSASLSQYDYSFIRTLTPIEWDVLRGYTRRIHSIAALDCGLDWKSVGIFLNPHTTPEPLFPNLYHISCEGPLQTHLKDFSELPFSSLVSINIRCINWKDVAMLQGSLESFSKFSPNISKLQIDLDQNDIGSSSSFSSCICQWTNLQTVSCDRIILDLAALTHLSHMPALTQLGFMLSTMLTDQIMQSGLTLVFSNLHEFTLCSNSLDLILQSFSQFQLPALTCFFVSIKNCPSRADVSLLLASVQMTGISHNIQTLRLKQELPTIRTSVASRLGLVLGLNDLLPCTAFGNLEGLSVDVDWEVNLSDNELLQLTSAWPRMNRLCINNCWGWRTPGGITPYGLLRVLENCPLLFYIAVCIDTRGYTELPESHAKLGSILTSKITFIHVIDSKIEVECVPAVGAFFASISSRPVVSFLHWPYAVRDLRMDHTDRWQDVQEVLYSARQHPLDISVRLP